MAAVINDIEYSWADIRVKARGKELIAFKGIKYGDKVTREKVYGARRHAIARTRGKVETDDCSITMYESAVRELLDILDDIDTDKLVDITEAIGKMRRYYEGLPRPPGWTPGMMAEAAAASSPSSPAYSNCSTSGPRRGRRDAGQRTVRRRPPLRGRGR
jgi:hypothetical protein